MTRLEEKRVIPFIGAGFSKSAVLRRIDTGKGKGETTTVDDLLELPGDRELFEQLIENVLHSFEKDDGEKREEPKTLRKILELFKKNEEETAFQELREFLKKNSFIYYRALRNILEPKNVQIWASPAHTFLRLMSFEKIITSNYDRLLERLVTPEYEVLTPLDATSLKIIEQEGSPFILKIHGEITRPWTIAYMSIDMIEFYTGLDHEAGKYLDDYLKELLKNHSLLFLGSSLTRNSELMRILKTIRQSKENDVEHYAFVPCVYDDHDEKKRLEEVGEETGIQMIYYNPDAKHSQLWEFVSYLNRYKMENEPVPGKVWEQFYLLEERAKYLERQLNLEKEAENIYFLTPTLTNAVDIDENITVNARKKMISKLTSENRENMTQVIDEQVIPMMLERKKNLLERLDEDADNLNIKILFMKEKMTADFDSPKAEKTERYKILRDLISKGRVEVRLLSGVQEDQLKEDEASFALIFGNKPKPKVDVAVAFASQATAEFLDIHTIQINTQFVLDKVSLFERYWNSALGVEESKDLIEQHLRRPDNP